MNYIRATYRLFKLSIATIYYLLWGYFQILLGKDRDLVSHQLRKNWGEKCLSILKFDVSVQNTLEQDPKGLIMANHRSYIDVLILFALYPSSIVAKSDIGKWPILSFAVGLADIILVDRGSMNSRLNTMNDIKERLEKDKRIILFPEGGIGDSHFPQKFKGGSFLIASQLNTTVTPITLWYEDKNDAWVGDVSFLKHFYLQMGKKKSHAKVKVMPPIYNERARALSQEVFDCIHQGVIEFEEGVENSLCV
ncbi:lysophospholipid acyltransferase family protein [Flammeovirga pacifica]|uniref:Phospholipid/glycerol acyltransferase domain-containing protein n=1 Tax=Flammeovirga pacifica TaxID=915059 RepID=A0A1S1YU46_FLAPC|nr:lysophospholipid acyltransferase family protein [Flammeovirga pacifica]OHX64541.1 hypothetical protein NH26_23490 [Flammeovirga pacifica]